MNKKIIDLYGILKIGDTQPTVMMGVLNLSPESFYQGSVYADLQKLKKATKSMVMNEAKILDLGARSTAPWSKKITVEEELERLLPAMELVSSIIPNDILISVDTQYMKVAEEAFKISERYDKKIIINDVSCLKTDPKLGEFIIKNNLPCILMASKEIPGDICTIKEIKNQFVKTKEELGKKGYDTDKIILDPGIGHWIEEKTPECDLRIITNLDVLKPLQNPILVAISRKSFIGAILNRPNPEDRLSGTLAATAIAVYNGAHIVRTHDVNEQLNDIIKMATELRFHKK
ncbi:MAG: dihydropteroate synthase [Candidatus Lokiarchaeota archaeon]